VSDELVLLSRPEPGIGLLTINRPSAMNALDRSVLKALEAGLEDLIGEETVRVIVFTGAGDKAFVAGGDIADLRSRRGLSHYLEYGEDIHRVFRRIETCSKPTIGAVNGWALGGGAELLLCLDLRVAAEEAKIGLPEISLGLFPGAGGSQRLLRQVSPCIARELMFTGAHVTAQYALSIGLINRVVPAAVVLSTAFAIARDISTRSPLTLKLLKRALINGADMPMPNALAYEQAMIGLVLDTDDAHEGCTAFLQKRPPIFLGD
jgi:enoyl-CoA hydratase